MRAGLDQVLANPVEDSWTTLDSSTSTSRHDISSGPSPSVAPSSRRTSQARLDAVVGHLGEHCPLLVQQATYGAVGGHARDWNERLATRQPGDG